MSISNRLLFGVLASALMLSQLSTIAIAQNNAPTEQQIAEAKKREAAALNYPERIHLRVNDFNGFITRLFDVPKPASPKWITLQAPKFELKNQKKRVRYLTMIKADAKMVDLFDKVTMAFSDDNVFIGDFAIKGSDGLKVKAQMTFVAYLAWDDSEVIKWKKVQEQRKKRKNKTWWDKTLNAVKDFGYQIDMAISEDLSSALADAFDGVPIFVEQVTVELTGVKGGFGARFPKSIQLPKYDSTLGFKNHLKVINKMKLDNIPFWIRSFKVTDYRVVDTLDIAKMAKAGLELKDMFDGSCANQKDCLMHFLEEKFLPQYEADFEKKISEQLANQALKPMLKQLVNLPKIGPFRAVPSQIDFSVRVPSKTSMPHDPDDKKTKTHLGNFPNALKTPAAFITLWVGLHDEGPKNNSDSACVADLRYPMTQAEQFIAAQIVNNSPRIVVQSTISNYDKIINSAELFFDNTLFKKAFTKMAMTGEFCNKIDPAKSQVKIGDYVYRYSMSPLKFNFEDNSVPLLVRKARAAATGGPVETDKIVTYAFRLLLTRESGPADPLNLIPNTIEAKYNAKMLVEQTTGIKFCEHYLGFNLGSIAQIPDSLLIDGKTPPVELPIDINALMQQAINSARPDIENAFAGMRMPIPTGEQMTSSPVRYMDSAGIEFPTVRTVIGMDVVPTRQHSCFQGKLSF